MIGLRCGLLELAILIVRIRKGTFAGLRCQKSRNWRLMTKYEATEGIETLHLMFLVDGGLFDRLWRTHVDYTNFFDAVERYLFPLNASLRIICSPHLAP